jgi:tetratricopeptide (TPR) repeat protein
MRSSSGRGIFVGSTGAHPDISTLKQALARRLPLEDLLELGWHLATCRRCRGRLERISPRAVAMLDEILPQVRPSRPQLAAGDYEGAFERVTRSLATRADSLAEDLARAPSLLAEIEDLPAAEWAERVRREPRFASRGLADLLLSGARARWAEDPAGAEERVSLALAVAERLDPERFGAAPLNDLRARAWAYLANVQRIRSDPRSVGESFRRAKDFLAEGSGDPIARAEILVLEAVFARAQRRFDEALGLLNQAEAAYRKADDRHMVGRCVLSKATVHGYAGRPERCVPLLRQALDLIDPGRDPRVYLSALQHTVFALNELGRRQEAMALMPVAREAAARIGSRLDRLRIRWTEGVLALDGGRYEEAEAALLAVKQGLVEEGIGYDAALVSLDLATLYLRQGRTAETRRLAAEMLPIFKSRDIHREALAALMVFCRAVEIEKVTVGMAQDIARYLKEARANPSLRYEEPS